MTCRIEAGILAFAVGKVLELPNDPGSMKPGPRQVRVVASTLTITECPLPGAAPGALLAETTIAPPPN